jgi:protein-S-isoprenylcysteine O-methyltransferase Ste14
MSRVFEIDVLQCPRCEASPMRILAAIHPPLTTQAILESPGLPARAKRYLSHCGVPLWIFLIDWLASAGWFPWASLSLPLWARWSGAGLGAVVAGLMWWTMVALGSNYRGTTGLHANHELVTHGPYRFVRHPMQAVAPLTSIVLFSLSANWVIGTGALVLIGTISIVRAPIEERELIERFGDEYRGYMQRAGRLFPRLRRSRVHGPNGEQGNR